jgi:hypothetical protein
LGLHLQGILNIGADKLSWFKLPPKGLHYSAALPAICTWKQVLNKF